MRAYQWGRIYILLVVICCSCSTTKGTFKKVTIKKNQRFYAYRSAGGAKADLVAVSAKRPMKATLRESGDALLLKVDNTALANDEGKVNISDVKGGDPIPEERSSSTSPNYYYSTKEGNYKGENNPFFHYRQWRLYLQGMAIPLKFRKGVDGLPAQGTIPAQPSISKQVEAGPTIALAPGIKHSWNRYQSNKNALGLTTTSFSTAIGFLVGLGTVDVDDKTTQNKVLAANATKNAIIPLGMHLVVGYNSLNIGAAFGWDLITGPNKESWVYKGKMWTGVIVGLDIIK
jgi:hypothetical protein